LYYKHVLKMDKSKCENCGSCEKILPRFKTIYEGRIDVSDWALEREDVKAGIALVVNSCPTKAISFSPL